MFSTGGKELRNFSRTRADLLDRLEVAEIVASTFVLAELGEWTRFAERYADPMILDYSPAITDGPQKIRRTKFVEVFRGVMETFDSTHHQVTNQLVDLQKHSAICRSQMRAAHRIGSSIWTAMGTYVHELERDPDRGWLIKMQRSIVQASEGDEAVLARYAERISSRLPGLPVKGP
jgi:hypothetical protein